MRPFHDEHGMTTVGMALALLLTLSLIFLSAHAYRTNSVATEMQSVADAAALAAENEVAEFMVVVKACDALILTMSLTAVTATGLGVVAACIPGCQGASQAFLQAARSITNARKAFSTRAVEVLNQLQRALPFMAAANAAGVAQANNDAASTYIAVALLSPLAANAINAPEGSACEDAQSSAESQAQDIQYNAEAADNALQEANECKYEAFYHDCGAATLSTPPGYCCYERAATVAGMQGSANPSYSSVDAWSFSVALKRAQAYYLARWDQEVSLDDSLEEAVRSAMRKNMFAYAKEHIKTGYVHETDESFEAYFPLMPRNTDEMRETCLYDDPVYPVTTNEEGESSMHAWSGCPAIDSIVGWDSIRRMEQEGFLVCGVCEFRASSLGKVLAASSSIENGFEYHYRIIAENASRYEAAYNNAKPALDSVKSAGGNLLDMVKAAFEEVAGERLVAHPPGSNGVVCLVVNVGSMAVDSGFTSSFVSSSGTLSTRAAISAATLVEDTSTRSESILTAFFDNVASSVGLPGGLPDVLFSAWSMLLRNYESLHEAVIGAIRDGLNGLPFLEKTGLGTWASNKLTSLIESVGLQPAPLNALRPVIVNSGHVASKGTNAVEARLVQLKQRAIATPLQSLDLFWSLIGSAEQSALQKVTELASGVEIARIEVEGFGISIPITIALPEVVVRTASDYIVALADQIRGIYGSVSGVSVWE